MKINVVKSNLNKALNAVSKAVSTKPTIEILKNIALEAKNGFLKLSATDLELSITTFIGADVIEEGATTVLAKSFIDFISLLPESNISLSLENNELRVKTDKVDSKFSTIPYDEFPNLAEVDSNSVLLFKVEKNLFIQAINKVLFAIDRSGAAQPVFSGALFEEDDDFVNIVGTDRFRLSKFSINISEKAKLDKAPVIPYFVLDNIAKLSMDTDSEYIEVFLSYKNNQVIFKNGRLELVSSLIDGEFPNYKDFLPQKKVLVCKIDTASFIESVKLSSVFGKNDDATKVLFKKDLEEKVLSVSTKVNEVGEYETFVDVDVIEETDKIFAYFSPKKVLDILTRIDSKFVILEFVSHPRTDHTMLIFKEEDNDNFFHLLTPLVGV